jgi:hypothetical protein
MCCRRTSGAKTTWRTLWKTFMQELAPQSKDGEYTRPSYDLRGRIGSAEFPVSRALYCCVAWGVIQTGY